jgi:hypothetical protein
MLPAFSEKKGYDTLCYKGQIYNKMLIIKAKLADI